MAQCTAQSKRSGRRCKNNAMIGREVCHIHGGKSLAGAAAPAYKTGRYSKYLPRELSTRWAEARNNPDLLSLEDDIALLEVRQGLLLERLSTGESMEGWRLMAELLGKLRKAEEPKEYLALLGEMEMLIEQGLDRERAWGELMGVQEAKRRQVETQRKTLVDMEQMITVERLLIFMSAVLSIAAEEFRDDRHALSRFTRRVDGLLSTSAA